MSGMALQAVLGIVAGLVLALMAPRPEPIELASEDAHDEA